MIPTNPQDRNQSPDNQCPDYYRLATGREFADFSQKELNAWLAPRVTPATYHALISAMEHRFRAGLKEGELETDRQAEKYWMKTAAKLFDDEIDFTEARHEFWEITDILIAMVDLERTSKDRQIGFQRMIQRSSLKHKD